MYISNKRQNIIVVENDATIDFSIYKVGQPVAVLMGNSYEYYKVAIPVYTDDDVMTCIQARILIPFSESDIYDTVEIYRKGSDLSSHNNLFIEKPIFRDKTQVSVFVNDNYFTNWDFYGQFENSVGYTQHLHFNQSLNDDDVIKIVYKEKIAISNNITFKLYRSSGKARNAMITKTITYNGTFYYLKDAETQGEDPTDWKVTYSTADNSAQHIIYKKFFDEFYLANFAYNEDLPDGYEIEVWGMDTKTNYDNSGNIGKLSLYRKSVYIPIKKYTTNRIKFVDFQGRCGIFRVRLRKKVNNRYVFSRFSEVAVSVRKFNVFTTNSTLTADSYKGFYYSAKLV